MLNLRCLLGIQMKFWVGNCVFNLEIIEKLEINLGNIWNYENEYSSLESIGNQKQSFEALEH